MDQNLDYSAGAMGQKYLQQMMMTEYCEVLGFIDIQKFRGWIRLK